MRSYGQEEFIFNPLHYLALLEQKPRALDQAALLQDWILPEVFDRLRRLLENFSQAQVEQAIKQAVGLGVVGFDAIKNLILCALNNDLPS